MWRKTAGSGFVCRRDNKSGLERGQNNSVYTHGIPSEGTRVAVKKKGKKRSPIQWIAPWKYSRPWFPTPDDYLSDISSWYTIPPVVRAIGARRSKTRKGGAPIFFRTRLCSPYFFAPVVLRQVEPTKRNGESSAAANNDSASSASPESDEDVILGVSR